MEFYLPSVPQNMIPLPFPPELAAEMPSLLFSRFSLRDPNHPSSLTGASDDLFLPAFSSYNLPSPRLKVSPDCPRFASPPSRCCPPNHLFFFRRPRHFFTFAGQTSLLLFPRVRGPIHPPSSTCEPKLSRPSFN